MNFKKTNSQWSDANVVEKYEEVNESENILNNYQNHHHNENKEADPISKFDDLIRKTKEINTVLLEQRENKIREIVNKNKELNSQTLELLTSTLTTGDTDILYVEKTIKKVASSQKVSGYSTNSNEKRNLIKYDNKNEKQNTSLIVVNNDFEVDLSKINKETKRKFEDLNNKYKTCLHKLNNLIADLLYISNDEEFEYNEDRLRTENEKDLLQIKYEFKNEVNLYHEINDEILNPIIDKYYSRLEEQHHKLEEIEKKLHYFNNNPKQSIDEDIKKQELLVKTEIKKPKINKSIIIYASLLVITLIILIVLIIVFVKNFT